ncbi:MBL fold metallo-hydrolase [Egicoccus sp. AB-alg6-2]|uniref:MBL fold metallo-hydrolase n=1 Tax=Egicoccus sp. AB-alg6-2 TaxID=3242692 RepID=UPI00359E46F2
MTPTLDILIQPVVLRFSIHQDEIVYHFASNADMQLDRMEHLMGIDPNETMLFDSNLGFLPIATTVLIRGERNIVIDPGNHHTGFYGQLGLSLRRFGLEFSDIDAVVASHCHHDHFSSVFKFPGSELVMGEGELDFARSVYGKETVDATVGKLGTLSEVPLDGVVDLCEGVQVVSTPGHTPGHVSVAVEIGDERILITGDASMTRSEYEDGAFSHWYEEDQRREVERSAERMRSLEPTLVLPGHDRAFRPQERR